MNPVAGLGRAKFDHAAHAAPTIREMLPLYREALGGTFLYGGDNTRVGYRGVVFGYAGGGKIELLEPLPGSGFFQSFFARSPVGGLHHLTFRVDDLGATLDRADAAGLDTFGRNEDNPDWREAFVHPRLANGALIQFVQAPDDHPRTEPAEALDELIRA